jgi:prepilin-type N-terminal cleavage/methylation domain-containing protein
MGRIRFLTIKNNRGFSIIELLVAATVIAVCTFGFISMMRKGGEISTADKHRRQARVTIDGLFETNYNYINYSQLKQKDFPRIDSFVIDTRPGGIPLQAAITAAISDSTVNQIPVKIINLTAQWKEDNGEIETIALSKWITQVL